MNHIEEEVEAIKAILVALAPLSPDVRANVLKYAIERFEIDFPKDQGATAVNPLLTKVKVTDTGITTVTTSKKEQVHIKDFKNQKKPRSANEMAALVAYYLATLAPVNERKDKITTREIDTYFKIAEFPLPKETRFTLTNAKAAGYFDSVGAGEFKLNAIGHNLVVHNMPRSTSGKSAPRGKAKKQSKRPAKQAKRPAKRAKRPQKQAKHPVKKRK